MNGINDSHCVLMSITLKRPTQINTKDINPNSHCKTLLFVILNMARKLIGSRLSNVNKSKWLNISRNEHHNKYNRGTQPARWPVLTKIVPKLNKAQIENINRKII